MRFRSVAGRELARFAQSLGFEIAGVNGVGHLRFRHPGTGQIVTAPSKPGPKTMRDHQARLRRVASEGSP